jgi:hypothetical protein
MTALKLQKFNLPDASLINFLLLCINTLQFLCLVNKLSMNKTKNLRSAGGQVNDMRDNFLIKAPTNVDDK